MSTRPPDVRDRRDLTRLSGRGLLPPEVRDAGGMQKLNWILSLAEPDAFVQALAPPELYLLMQDIGLDDAAALLELADREQIQGLLDLDLWSRHELRLERWVRWLEVARSASVDVALEVINATEPELIQLLFTGDARVYASDLDVDAVPDELHVFPTPDGTFFVTIDREHPLADGLVDLMKLLWAADMDRALDIFQTARFEVAANLEETLLRFRRGRLEDMGFLAPDEALAIYSYLDPRAARQRVREHLAELPDLPPAEGGGLARDLVLRGLEPSPLLAEALARLDEEPRTRFAQGFVHLVNRVFMARTGDVSQADELPAAGRHASALAGLGLAWLADESPDKAAAVLRRVHAEHLFRVGYSLVFDLTRRARRLRARAGARLGLHLFGPPVDDALEGLAQPRPVLFEGLDDPALATFRDVASLADLARLRVLLDDADAVLAFFEQHLGFSPDALLGAPLAGLSDEDRHHVRLSTLLRTGLARTLLEDAFTFEPLGADDLRAFLQLAFDRDPAPGDPLPRRSAVLQRAAAALAEHVPPPVQAWMDAALDELQLALGRVAVHDLDPRYAAELLLVRR